MVETTSMAATIPGPLTVPGSPLSSVWTVRLKPPPSEIGAAGSVTSVRVALLMNVAVPSFQQSKMFAVEIHSRP